MKTVSIVLKNFKQASLILVLMMSGPALFAQKKDSGKIHLRMEEEINGKTIHVDTIYSPDQQEAIDSYLKSLGLEMSSPSEPPVPPSPPDAPGAPQPPPPPPAAPHRNKKDIVIHIDKENISKEEQEELDKEMEKMREEMSNFKLPDMPEINIDMDGWKLETRKQINKEMEQLKDEMKQLQERMEDLKIVIKENDSDSKDKKEESEFHILTPPDGLDFQANTNQQPYKIKMRGDSMPDKYFLFMHDDEGSPAAGSRIMIKTISENEDGDKESKTNKTEHQIIVLKRKKDQGSFKKEDHPLASRLAESANPYELQPDNFNAYPNPGEGIFNLDFTLKTNDPVQIKIMDSAGKLVYEENLEDFNGNYQKQIDIGKEGKGIYLLSITQGNQWMHKKLVVK